MPSVSLEDWREDKNEDTKRKVTQEEDLLWGEEVEEKRMIFRVAMTRTRIKHIQNQEGVM